MPTTIDMPRTIDVPQTADRPVVTRPVISDQWAAKVDSSTFFRLVCLAWLVPAISMIWIGFAAIGLRSSSQRSMQIALDRVQAMSMMLTIFGVLIGLSWALRVWTYLPALSRLGTSRGRFGLGSHGVTATVGALALLLAETVNVAQVPLAIVAVLAGLYACSLAGRWVLMAPVIAPFPLAMLAFGAAYQVTVGWIHRAELAGVLAPLLVIEGLILAWMAIAAARAVAQIAAVQAATVEAAVDSDDVEVLASQAPARLPLPAPVAGH